MEFLATLCTLTWRRLASKRFKDGSKQWSEFWAKQPVRGEANIALRNLGDLRFQEVSEQCGLHNVGVSFGAATADFDNDGDLDLGCEQPECGNERLP